MTCSIRQRPCRLSLCPPEMSTKNFEIILCLSYIAFAISGLFGQDEFSAVFHNYQVYKEFDRPAYARRIIGSLAISMERLYRSSP